MRSDGGVAGRSCVCTVRKSAGGMVHWCVLLVVVRVLLSLLVDIDT